MRPVLSPSSLFNAASVYTEADSRPVLYTRSGPVPLPSLMGCEIYKCMCVYMRVCFAKFKGLARKSWLAFRGTSLSSFNGNVDLGE